MAFTLWFTGLPGSGKTTIAKEILKTIDAQLLDGDLFRKNMSKDLGFSREDRRENLRRASLVCKFLNESGTNVIAAFASPRIKMRELIKKNIGSESFLLVYVKCSVEECIRRDPKGLYKKALKGEIPMFTGISAPYEEPKDPDLILNTEKETIKESVNKTLRFLERKGLGENKSTLFIGRFSPPHLGHKYLFDSVLDNGGRIVIAIRNTPITEKDPLTAEERKKLLKTLYPNNSKVKIIIIPDIKEVCVGRKVGYKIFGVPEKIKKISATKVREGEFEHIPIEIRELVKKMLKEKKN